MYPKFLENYFTMPLNKDESPEQHEERIRRDIPTSRFRRVLLPLLAAWDRTRHGAGANASPLSQAENDAIFKALNTVDNLSQRPLIRVHGNW